ncbi:3'-5' exonuclease [Thermanaerothrix sp.]|jgi:DNA polymerase-3 subunit epsilon|uniref:3'-5' exonuclease n=1 Tax=Thermanaerothrix sp. TaxID=2972675 RepID=UPI002ADE610E|nr:3'-5' exonuclease [Thermanaerothrix sp.]
MDFALFRNQIREFARQQIEQRPLYLDTETTGLDKNAEIVEIAIIEHDGSPLFQSLVRPSRPIPPEVIAVHGIHDDEVKTAPPWPIVWNSIRPLLKGRLIAAYNADFDRRMMEQSLTRYGFKWQETLTTLDIMQIFADYRGEWDPNRRAYRYFKLEEAGRFLGIPLPNSHRALDDARLARAVLHAIAGLPY